MNIARFIVRWGHVLAFGSLGLVMGSVLSYGAEAQAGPPIAFMVLWMVFVAEGYVANDEQTRT